MSSFILDLIVVFSLSFCGLLFVFSEMFGFSLRSKKARLTGEWELVKINGQKLSSFSYSYDSQTWEIEGNGDFELSSEYGTYSYSIEGEWEWEDNKEAISIQLDGSSYKSEFEIKRLTNKELKIEDDSNNDEYEFEKK